LDNRASKHLAYLWERNEELLERCRAQVPNKTSLALQARLIDQGLRIAAMVGKSQIGVRHGDNAGDYLQPEETSGNQSWRLPRGPEVPPDEVAELLKLPRSDRMLICEAAEHMRALLRLENATVKQEWTAAGRVHTPRDVELEACARTSKALHLNPKEDSNYETKPPTALLSEDR
jgi:hypothetical protein